MPLIPENIFFPKPITLYINRLNIKTLGLGDFKSLRINFKLNNLFDLFILKLEADVLIEHRRIANSDLKILSSNEPVRFLIYFFFII
jgi:hypothetical protein